MKLIALIVFTSLGIFIFLYGAYYLWQELNYRLNAESAQAVVTSNELKITKRRGVGKASQGWSSMPKWEFITEVEFAHDGKSYQAILMQKSSEPYVVGRKLPIRFFPQETQHEVHYADTALNYVVPLLMVLFGLFLIGTQFWPMLFAKLGSPLPLGLAIVFLLIGVYTSFDFFHQRLVYSENATATVIEGDRISTTDGGSITAPKIEYTYGREIYHAYLEVQSNKNPSIGKKINVLIDPADPWSAAIKSSFAMLFTGLVFFALGIFVLSAKFAGQIFQGN